MVCGFQSVLCICVSRFIACVIVITIDSGVRCKCQLAFKFQGLGVTEKHSNEQ